MKKITIFFLSFVSSLTLAKRTNTNKSAYSLSSDSYLVDCDALNDTSLFIFTNWWKITPAKLKKMVLVK